MSQLPRTLEPEVMDTVTEAVDYDGMDHSTVNRVFVDDLLQFISRSDTSVRPENLGHVVDIGTGTALIPMELTSRSVQADSVIACDLSVEMLRLANRHLQGTDTAALLLPTFCDAKQLPLKSQRCDVVMSNSIVHHIPSPVDVFREMKRIVSPGGIIFVRDLMRPDDDAEVEEFVSLYAGGDNSHQQQLFRQSLHAALTTEEVSDLLKECDWPAEWVCATSDRHWTVTGIAS